MKKWNIYTDKIIHNDIQYCVMLIITGICAYEDMDIETKELYDSLTEKEKKYLKKRLDNVVNK